MPPNEQLNYPDEDAALVLDFINSELAGLYQEREIVLSRIRTLEKSKVLAFLVREIEQTPDSFHVPDYVTYLAEIRDAYEMLALLDQSIQDLQNGDLANFDLLEDSDSFT